MAWYRLVWPRTVEFDRLQAVALLLAGSGGAPVIVEAVGRGGVVEHHLGVPRQRARVTEHIRTAFPDLALIALDGRQETRAQLAVALRLTSAQRLLRLDRPELVARAIVTALSHTHRDEELVLQWQLLTSQPPQYVASTAERAEPLPMSISDVLLGRRGQLDAEARQALRAKRALPVWRAVGLIGVKAATEGRRQLLLNETVGALRLADAPGVRMMARRCAADRIDKAPRSWLAPLRLNAAELATVAGWPIGSVRDLRVDGAATRSLPPSDAVPRAGRVIGLATAPGHERPIALNPPDALRHLHVVAPTGAGKTTLLLNTVLQDVEAGRAVVVIEPKGDLIADVAARIPAHRLADVVLLDPSDDQRPVGLNPLAVQGRPAELVADELLGLFRGLYESSWGPRTNDILGASLLTLARTPGMTLCALPVLLTDSAFRHRVVSRLDDPVGLELFWNAYEEWSPAERVAAIAPTMNRIRPFLMRPQLRAVLGQAQPRFELRQVFTEHKVLLVNLAKGIVGREAAALLGGFILSQLWAATLERARIRPELRHPTYVYIDELQDYQRLPLNLSDALVQARGLGVSFAVAHQNLSQLDAGLRSAVLTNVQSRVCFQLPADDARVLASGSLSADDLRELPAYHVYAQLVAGGATQPWCSARTLPPPPIKSNPDDVRRTSRERYGVDRRVVDEEVARLLDGTGASVDDVTPRRRADRGTR